jgi:TolB protein
MPCKRISTNVARLTVVAVALVLDGVFLGALGPTEAAYPGHNGRIFFHSTRVTKTNRGGDYEVFTMRADGSRVRQVTHNAVDDFAPSVSANGKKIAFMSTRDGNAEIYVMRADGSGQTRLTNSTEDDTAPALSPDGQTVAFERRIVNANQIYTIGTDGSDETAITSDSTNRNPAWSPDGATIAFNRFAAESNSNDIFTMDPNGGNQAPLTFESSNDLRPNWSPDGAQIAFMSNEETAENADGDFEIFVLQIPPDSSREIDVTQLTENAEDDYEPVWSPDQTRIAFYRDLDGDNLDVFVMRADGSGEKRLTKNPADDSDADWQPRR